MRELGPRLALAAALLLRPLATLELGARGARSLGVSLAGLRLDAITLAIFITASIVARLGVIGFVGLAAPALMRAAGAHTPAARLHWSPGRPGSGRPAR